MMKRATPLKTVFGHWTRRRFLPEALAVYSHDVAEPDNRWWKQEDTYLFLMSFGAFFTMITTFIW